MVKKCSREPRYLTIVKTPPTRIEDKIIRVKLRVSMRRSTPLSTNAPITERASATHCHGFTYSFKNQRAKTALKIGAVYLNATADPKGIRWITTKYNAREAKLKTPLVLSQKTLLPTTGTFLMSI